MATVEERISGIEATLPHLATKADLARLEGKVDALANTLLVRLGGVMVVVGGLVVAFLKFWPG